MHDLKGNAIRQPIKLYKYKEFIKKQLQKQFINMKAETDNEYNESSSASLESRKLNEFGRITKTESTICEEKGAKSNNSNEKFQILSGNYNSELEKHLSSNSSSSSSDAEEKNGELSNIKKRQHTRSLMSEESPLESKIEKCKILGQIEIRANELENNEMLFEKEGSIEQLNQVTEEEVTDIAKNVQIDKIKDIVFSSDYVQKFHEREMTPTSFQGNHESMGSLEQKPRKEIIENKQDTSKNSNIEKRIQNCDAQNENRIFKENEKCNDLQANLDKRRINQSRDKNRNDKNNTKSKKKSDFKESNKKSEKKYDRKHSEERSNESHSRKRNRSRSRSVSTKKIKREKSKSLLVYENSEKNKNPIPSNSEKNVHPDPMMTARQRRAVDLLTSRTGGAYIPPAKLRLLQAEITDKSSAAYQRIAWEALKKSIHGYINKVNVDNIAIITRELLKENIIRGRGLLCRSIIQAQAASPTFTHVYAALVAIINSKFPNIGELLLKRLVIQFKRGFRRNDKIICLSSSRFIAHLVNQRVVHEILALEILTLLVEHPTDDSVEVAIAFLRECGMKLTEVSSKGISAIFDMLKNILHEGKLDKRVQYMIEVVFQVRKDGFKDHQSVIDSLELVEEDDQFTHLITLDEATETQDHLNVFKFDDKYQENENKYSGLSKELLGSDAEELGSSSGSENDSGDSESGGEDDEHERSETIIDNTETNLVALRRTIYLTIHSSLDYEECAHKLMKMELKPGQEPELCHMFLDCCAEQRTYEKFYGLLAQRFCSINKIYIEPFEEIFRATYSTTHRLDTNRLRNVSKFFAHLLFTDAIGWDVMECVHLNEEETTSSSRIFIKILFQELAEYMGLSKLNERLKDSAFAEPFSSLFPRDNPKNTRFAINFFTSIGLGGLTDDLRQFLKNAPKSTPIVNQELARSDLLKITTSNSNNSSSSSSSSSSNSSSSCSSGSGSKSSGSKSNTDSDSEVNSKNKRKKVAKESRKTRKTLRKNLIKSRKKIKPSNSDSNCSSSECKSNSSSGSKTSKNKKRSKKFSSTDVRKSDKTVSKMMRNPFRSNEVHNTSKTIEQFKKRRSKSQDQNERKRDTDQEKYKKKKRKANSTTNKMKNSEEHNKGLTRLEDLHIQPHTENNIFKENKNKYKKKSEKISLLDEERNKYIECKPGKNGDRDSKCESKFKEKSEMCSSREDRDCKYESNQQPEKHRDQDSPYKDIGRVGKRNYHKDSQYKNEKYRSCDKETRRDSERPKKRSRERVI